MGTSTKNYQRYGLFLAIMLLLTATRSVAQLSGTISVPSTAYPSLASVISALDSQGVSANLTVNIASGFTETAPAGGYVIQYACAPANYSAATRTVTFQGGTVDAVITASGSQTAGSVTDAVFAIVGADYIRFDKVDVKENAANTTATIASNNMTEYGYALFKASALDGAQRNTISNCSVSLSKLNTNSIGIYVASHGRTSSSVTSNIAPTAFSGTNSYNKIYGDSVSNVADGIVVNGANTSGFNDEGNEVGGQTAALGNVITNFGGGSAAPTQPTAQVQATIFGVYTAYQQGVLIKNNIINGGAGTTAGIGAILNDYNDATGSNPGATISKNSVAITCSVTTNQMNVVKNAGGGTGGVVSIDSNTITLVANSMTSGNFYGIIAMGAASSALNVTNNTLQNFSVAPSTNATGTVYFINTQNGAHAVENISGNTIQNNVVRTSGVTYTIFNSASPASLAIRNNVIANDTNLHTAGTWYNIYQSGAPTVMNRISNNMVRMGTFSNTSYSGTIYGVYNTGSIATATVAIDSNTFKDLKFTGTTGGTGTMYFIYNVATVGTCSLNNNVYDSLSLKSTGTLYMMYDYNGTPNQTISNNAVNGFLNRTVAGSGTFYGLYNLYGSTTGTSTIFNNNFSNINTGSSTGSMYILYYGQSATQNVYNNTISNITSIGTGTCALIYPYYYGTTVNYYNNTISNVTYAGTLHGAYIYGYSMGTLNFYNNTLSGLTTTGNAGTVNGVFAYYLASTTNIYKNKITSLTASGATTCSANGINIGVWNGSASTPLNIYNNTIGSFSTPASTNANAQTGITFGVGSASYYYAGNAYFNTIYLAGTSTGAAFGTAGVHVSSANPTVTLRNNIIYNNTTLPTGGTGKVTAYRRPSTIVTSYGNASNNNLFSVSTGGSLMWDGTATYNTLAGYQAAVTPRDAQSISETPNFLSTTATATNFLHINPATATAIESGATNISGITDDFDADVRAGNTGYTGTGGISPDMGADEFNGTTPAPQLLSVAKTPAANLCTATARTVTASVKVGSIALSSVTLNYTYNGAAQTPVTMTLASGTNTAGATTSWSGTIPAATPTNAVVAFTVTATDGTYSVSAAGTGYQDNALAGFSVILDAQPDTVCSGTPDTLLALVSNPTATMPTGYCAAAATYTGDEEITKVVFGTINNTTSCASLTGSQGTATGTVDMYSNFTASTVPVPNVSAGATMPIAVQMTECNGNAYTHSVAVFIDFNRNGSLLDAGESFTILPSTSNGLVVDNVTGSIAIPTNISVGPTLMRVITNEGAIANGCSNPSWGEVEDYKINLVGNAGITFAWTSGSSTVGTTNPLIVTPLSTTSYSATATNANGCTLAATTPVSVTVLPIPTTPNGSNSTQCGPHVPSCSVSSTSGASSPVFKWYETPSTNVALAGQSGTTLTGLMIYATDTFYVSELGGNGCQSGRKMVIANITTPPAVTVSAPTGICSGSSATITATSTNVNYTYNWTPGPLTGGSVTVSPTGATTYYLTAADVTTGSFGGCVKLDSITVYVNAQQQPPVITPVSPTICQGTSVALTATPQLNPIIFNESFESGTSGLFTVTIPSTNTATNTNYAPTWTNKASPYTNSGSNTVSSGSAGNKFMHADANAGGSGSLTHCYMTTTGSYNTSGYTTLALNFRQFYQTYPGDSAAVDVSTNGGTSWTTVYNTGAVASVL